MNYNNDSNRRRSPLMALTKDEMEQVVELIAIRVAERYFGIMKEYINGQINLHTAQCAAAKYGWVKSIASAVLGGVIVGVIMWTIKGGA